MKPAAILDHSGLNLPPILHTAFAKGFDAWAPALRHLPVPVRFRASGALRAWITVLDTLPGTESARAALQDPTVPPQVARAELFKALDAHIKVPTRDSQVIVPRLQSLISGYCYLLCFWLRSGAIYEPTLPLGGLLGGVDMSQELPMEFLQTPCPTLCIIPPWQQRHHCANASAIMVFSHEMVPVQTPAKRSLTLLALRTDAQGLTIDELKLPVVDESTTLASNLSKVAEGARASLSKNGLEGEDIDALMTDWKQVLDYTVKVLLYLKLDEAKLRFTQPYTQAPKEFPGLGRRKRELKMAEVEKLYDSYIVGPVTVADWAGEHATELGSHGQLSAHWRRGHFRLHAHGPQASLRKLLFIMPTIVRADRLSSVA